MRLSLKPELRERYIAKYRPGIHRAYPQCTDRGKAKATVLAFLQEQMAKPLADRVYICEAVAHRLGLSKSMFIKSLRAIAMGHPDLLISSHKSGLKPYFWYPDNPKLRDWLAGDGFGSTLSNSDTEGEMRTGSPCLQAKEQSR